MPEGNCAECGKELKNSGWTIGAMNYCGDCGNKILSDKIEVDKINQMTKARQDAKEMARKLGRTVWVIEACPDRPLHTTFKRPAFLLEADPAFGGVGFTPEGDEVEEIHWT